MIDRSQEKKSDLPLSTDSFWTITKNRIEI